MAADLVDWTTAMGTIGAAVFAGWAAWSSRSAVRESRRLVDIEIQRDRDRAEAEITAQARRVSVGLITEPLHDSTGQVGVDFHLVVVNASDSPVFKVRLDIVAGDGEWGPQLCGNLLPGQQVELYARVCTSADLSNTDASIRFVDVNDRAWVASARAPARPDSNDLSDWISRGQTFASRDLDLYERGTWHGVAAPDFEGWRDNTARRQPGSE